MMYDLPDHPVIANMMRTGYPDGKEPQIHQCPVCGGEITGYTYLFVSNITGDVLGCESCISIKELEDLAECPVCGDMVSELYVSKGKPIGCKKCVAQQEAEDVYG